MYMTERTKGMKQWQAVPSVRRIQAELEITRSFEFRTAATADVKFKLNSIRPAQIADSQTRTSRNIQNTPRCRHLSCATQTGPSAFFTGAQLQV
jgi:hypothetical protein